MIRGTKATLIIKKELENGSVKVVHYKEFIEYWVYDTPGSLDSATGVYTLNKPPDSGSPVPSLKCIIVCDNGPEHIVKDLPTHYLVTGAVFNDNEYPDLTDYLCRTERPPQ
jgi:hypothetical protein